MTSDLKDLSHVIEKAGKPFQKAREEIKKIVIGQEHLIQQMLIACLSDGHLLLEGVPGLAKTLAVNTLAKVISCDFKRVQFTPDLLPADLVGTSIYNPKEGTFSVKKGPLFTNIVLGDEINRAPAKVQAALLEVMQERQISIGGTTFTAPDPFLVLATQNPIEQEGTYPLPEAQTDRFLMKVEISYLDREQEKELLKRSSSLENIEIEKQLSIEEIQQARQLVQEIYVDEKVYDYILNIIFATRHPEEFKVDIKGLLDYGASPRASLALKRCAQAHAFLDQRGFVTPHDVKSIAFDVMRHRLKLSYEAEAEEIDSNEILTRIFDTIQVP